MFKKVSKKESERERERERERESHIRFKEKIFKFKVDDWSRHPNNCKTIFGFENPILDL